MNITAVSMLLLANATKMARVSFLYLFWDGKKLILEELLYIVTIQICAGMFWF